MTENQETQNTPEPSHWVDCPVGGSHWGRLGAAGILVMRGNRGGVDVLLQQRALWTHHGGEWSTPGGALEDGETPLVAALREFEEEAGVSRKNSLFISGHFASVCQCGWRYDVFVAVPHRTLRLRKNRESARLSWINTTKVSELDLLSAFRQSWEQNAYLANSPASVFLPVGDTTARDVNLPGD